MSTDWPAKYAWSSDLTPNDDIGAYIFQFVTESLLISAFKLTRLALQISTQCVVLHLANCVDHPAQLPIGSLELLARLDLHRVGSTSHMLQTYPELRSRPDT